MCDGLEDDAKVVLPECVLGDQAGGGVWGAREGIGGNRKVGWRVHSGGTGDFEEGVQYLVRNERDVGQG